MGGQEGGEIIVKNPMIMTIIVALIVGGAAFFGGMQYQKTQSSSPMQGQFRGPNGGGQQGVFQGGSGNRQGMTPVSGEIISQDDASITVKMQDGSSKIVILSDDTSINKSSEGSKSDLKTGETITAFGTSNSDGSITAQNVSIGGNMMFRSGPPGQNNQTTPAQ